MGCLSNSGEIGHPAKDVGILDHHAAGLTVDGGDHASGVRLCRQRRRAPFDHVSGELGHGLDRRGIVRVQPGTQHGLAPLGHAPRHRHRFPGRGRAIVHRGIGDLGSEQPRHLRLEFEQHLQCALRDFRLIRRIGGQELAALDQVIDAGRNMVAIGPCPEEERHRPGTDILAGQRRHVPLHRHFAGMHRQVRDWAGEAGFGGYIDEQVIDRCRANDS